MAGAVVATTVPPVTAMRMSSFFMVVSTEARTESCACFDGFVTYPPDEHALRDLEVISWLDTEDHAVGELPVLDHMRDERGAVSAGALVTLVDLVCARIVLHAVEPHWIATADLSFVSGVRPTDGVVTAEARIARAGSKLVVADVDLGPVGRAVATFVRIPREASRVSDRPPPRMRE